MVKKSTTRAVPNISSAAAPSASTLTRRKNESAILRSAFSPSRFQLSLFASVIQSLDSQQLRIHDTMSGRLKCEHTPPQTSITCLDWGYYGSSRQDEERPSKKKRRKLKESQDHGERGGEVVVALGTDRSEIQMFSPADSRVLATLRGGHMHGVRDFKFKEHGMASEAWSIGGDDKLVQWSLNDASSVRSISLSMTSINTMLLLPSSLLIASHTAYLLDPSSPEDAVSFSGFTQPIHSLFAQRASQGESEQDSPILFLAASESDRFINVYDVQSQTIIGSLVTGNEVDSLAYVSSESSGAKSGGGPDVETLAAVTKDGEVEVFDSPFGSWTSKMSKDPQSLKAMRKQKTRKATATVKVIRPDSKGRAVPVVNASFQDNELVLALAESSVDLSFDRVMWKNEDSDAMVLTGVVELQKAKTGGLGASSSSGAKDMNRSHLDESKTVTLNGIGGAEIAAATEPPEVIDISSGVEESEDSNFEEDEAPNETALPNGVHHSDEEMQESDNADEQKDGEENAKQDRGEPSFGELIRAKAPETIDVAASFPKDQSKQAVVPSLGHNLSVPTGISLGTVLSQSLRTNDVNLLESCFHVQDLHIVRATIERLDSTLASILLQKLAERLHGRPGRAGSLMVWIQWTLVAHGGYLGTQPDVISRLTSLHRVVRERANSLKPLLSLKGKLDMLEAQMNLRRSMQQRYGTANSRDKENEGVVYVEGQEESSSEESEAEDTKLTHKRGLHSGSDIGMDQGKSGAETQDEDESDEEASDAMEVDTDRSEDEESSNSGSLIENEASDTDNDSGSEEFDEEVDLEDMDSGDESGESADAGPAKAQPRPKINGVLPETH